MTSNNPELNYPLHFAIWQNNYEELNKLLEMEKYDKNEQDPRGRTPLMLAVTLGHLESVKVLLKHECSVFVENKEGWTVLQEATATGDPEILSAVLESRDMERVSSRLLGIPSLLSKLSDAPDFYVEMKWEFTSWVPLVSRMCPSDTYHVYKRGSNVRIDTTLLGFDQTQWQRGNRSYIFKKNVDGAIMYEVDHDKKQVYMESIQPLNPNDLSGQLKPHSSVIAHRLSSPIVTTYIDTDKISFERDKKGIWGWRNDRSEVVNDHECKVFSASNVELVTKTRTEHMSEADKKQSNTSTSPIQSFLNIAKIEEEQELILESKNDTDCSNNEVLFRNPENIQAKDYFDPSVELESDIGRPKEVNSKIQKFKGHLWLAEEYPLKLQEQVMPIVDIMAISSSHFAKLKDFIQMQLPSGFPVKIEIPLFHVLTARITFGNIFGLDSPVNKVSTIEEDDRLSCIIEDSVFEPPSSYTPLGSADNSSHYRQMGIDEDDALLQFAIQQSIMESSRTNITNSHNEDQIDVWEALQSSQRSDTTNSNCLTSSDFQRTTPNHLPLSSSIEETQLQRAIAESLAINQNVSSVQQESVNSSEEVAVEANDHVDSDMALALSMSQKQQELEEKQRKQEEEILNKILELSLTEK